MTNKIKESNISDGAVTSNKIAPGTIATDRLATDPTNASNLASGTVANARLAGSGALTINGTSIALGASGNIVAGTDWQSVITADGSTVTTAVASEGYIIDSGSATHTINLPSSPSVGDEVNIVALDGATNAVTVGRNGSNIEGSASDLNLSSNYAAVTLVYSDAANGWYRHNNEAPDSFLTATGGTVTESGDFKIHTFNSSGNFVVSQLSSVTPNNTVSYMVVAGGAGGGSGCAGGGGGAGGFREGRNNPVDSYTSSPIAAGSGILVTTATYPITVGSGGTGGGDCGSGPRPSTSATDGSNSTFSTITSAGGGHGAGGAAPGAADGGSGGGGGHDVPTTSGSGNVPPVSPPQGNNGATSNPNNDDVGGGGGGAGAAAVNPAKGGAGVSTEISGSAVGYAGGGGGGVRDLPGGDAPLIPSANPVGRGGSGGTLGTSNSAPVARGVAGTANSGGGGGGASRTNGPTYHLGGNGGAGVVIIRYKYQG